MPKYDDLHAAYIATQDAVRADPADPDAAADYRTAAAALDAHRATGRRDAGRTGVGFGPDMIRSEG